MGWVNENSLSKKIKLILKNLKIGDLINQITKNSGILILKNKNIELNKKKLNIKKEMKDMIMLEKNNQLNQYSNIYFKKISRNTEVNEL